MAEEQSTDYSQIYDFLYRIERRITYLEKDAAFIDKKIISLEEKRLKDFELMTQELKDLRSSIGSMKTHFSQCAHGMARLSKDLKDTVKKDDIQNLNTELDEIRFEEYVTTRDLERGL